MRYGGEHHHSSIQEPLRLAMRQRYFDDRELIVALVSSIESSNKTSMQPS